MNNFFENLNNTQRMLVLAIMAVIIYGVSTAVSYQLFASLKNKPGSSSKIATTALPGSPTAVEEDPSAPKTEVCPLDGGKHTKATRESWEKRRPLAVMIENHLEARPQSGLSSADVVYEAVAEGGITRFMALFYCLGVDASGTLSEVQVGPVRSARTYYLDWLSEYDALYAHVGGANTPGPANALGQIIDYKIKDMNQFSIGFPTFWRDYQRLGHPVATEHTMYSTTTKLWDVAAKKGWAAADSMGVKWDKNFVTWKFKDDAAGSGQTNKVSVNFWESQGDYKVEWNYDAKCNCYNRKNGGTDHTDLDNKKQLSPKNVVVQYMKESHANDGYENNVHLLYATNGSKGALQGKAVVFQDGKAIKGQWMKKTRVDREKFVDENNKEIEFVRGQIWIQTVPEGSSVTY